MKLLVKVLAILSCILLIIQLLDYSFYDLCLVNPVKTIAKIESINQNKDNILNGKITTQIYSYNMKYFFTVKGIKYESTVLFGLLKQKKKITEVDYQKYTRTKYLEVVFYTNNPLINDIVSTESRNWKNGLYLLKSISLIFCVTLTFFCINRPKMKSKHRNKYKEITVIDYVVIFFSFIVAYLFLLHIL